MIIRREKTKRLWLSTHRSIVEKALSLASGLNLPSLVPSLVPSAQKTHRPSCEEIQESLTPASLSVLSLPQHDLPFVSPDEILLAQGVMNSNIIYSPETDADKTRFKKVTRELNRIIKVNQLRKREPNPYERPYLKQRTPSVSSRDGSVAGDTHVGIKLVNGSSPLKGLNDKSPKNKPHPVNGGLKTVNGSSSLLIKTAPLTPKKNSYENLKQQSPSSLLKKSPSVSPPQLKLRNHKVNNNSLPHSLLKRKTGGSTASSKSRSKVKKLSSSTKPIRRNAVNGVIPGQTVFGADDQKQEQGCCIS